MAFYSQHPFYQRRQAASPSPSPFATVPAYGYAPAHHSAPAPSFNFYTSPTPDHGYDDLEAEENAALAHLHAIQQRREASQLNARREAAAAARAAAEREAAVKVALERHRQAELLRQVERQRQVELQRREDAIRHHFLVAAEQARREEVQRAIAQQHRQEQLQQAKLQQAVAAEQHRRAIAAARQRQIAHAAHAAQAAERAAAEENLKRRNACARRCAGGCKKEEQKEEAEPDWSEFSDLLSSMFGFNIAESAQSAKEEKPVEKKVEKPVEKKAEAAPAPASTLKTDTPRASSPKASEAAPENNDPRATIDLNNLISSFLGYNVAPANADDKPAGNSEAMSNNLNKFLNQFGLEFEAINNGEPSSSSSASKPTPSPAPATSSASASAPAPTPAAPAPTAAPATSAPTIEGKGKAVAEGEKPARDAETSVSLDKLRDISHELHLVTESFTFPSHLSFADTPSSSDTTPALLFNKSNSGYHAQAHKLLQLLLAADGISSGGDREVRKQRKAIVKAIEGAIEKLEQKRDAVWQEVREKRERGEESDDEGSVSSWNSSEHEHIEHVEHAEGDKVDTTYAEVAAEAQGGNSHTEEAKGFEVPEPTPTDNKPTAKEIPTSQEESKVEEAQPKVPETRTKYEKEDGYELL